MTVERDDDRGFHVRGTYDDGKQGWPSPGGEWHFDGNVGQPEKEGTLALIEQWKKASRNSATR